MATQYIDFHTHRLPSQDVIALRSYSVGMDNMPEPIVDAEHTTAGVHPWHILHTNLDHAMDILRQLNIVAIGEIGLDYAIDTNRELQTEVFEQQLDIAHSRSLPVVIHCVRAFEDVIRLLVKYKIEHVVFHSFTGNKTQLKRVVDAGYYVSLSPVSLGSAKTIEAVKATDRIYEYMFLETDDSNELIENIYERCAKLLNTTTQQLKENIYRNYITFFE